jgi:aryl-alcohol dehydrogenase-like predicted oxidoreductase
VADFPAFVAAGIDTFDMGPETCGYGPAEAVVGEYIRSAGGATNPALCFTKLCCVGQEQAKPSGEWVRSRVDRALSRLGGHARLDLMQLYWNTYDAGQQNLTDMSLFLMDERAAGRVGAVGFTNMDTAHLAALADAGVEVAAHQIQFSLLDRRPAREQLAWCAKSGCKLLPYGVLAGGLLSDAFLGVPADAVTLDTYSKGKYAAVIRRAGGWDWFQCLLTALRAVGDAHGGASISNVAARWVLEQPSVGALILGARNAAHVSDHRALFAFALTPADRAAIDAVLAQGTQPAADTYSWERGGGVF